MAMFSDLLFDVGIVGEKISYFLSPLNSGHSPSTSINPPISHFQAIDSTILLIHQQGIKIKTI
jgi:hypothetical protein